MNVHRIWISSGQQLEDEIWADSQRCQDTIVDLLQPRSPDTVVSYGAVPGGAGTSADTWCGACGSFMWHGAPRPHRTEKEAHPRDNPCAR